jgi:hypothetical protein
MKVINTWLGTQLYLSDLVSLGQVSTYVEKRLDHGKVFTIRGHQLDKKQMAIPLGTCEKNYYTSGTINHRKRPIGHRDVYF